MIINFHPSSAESASGNSSSMAIGNLVAGTLFVNVTAKSGTLPTLAVKVQHSPNDSDWYDVSGLTTNALNSVLATSVAPNTLMPLADYVRVAWTIGGVGPSFTFSVDLSLHSL